MGRIKHYLAQKEDSLCTAQLCAFYAMEFLVLKFEQIHSRINIDSAIFTFGVPKDLPNAFCFRIFCAGESSYSVEQFDPSSLDQLKVILHKLCQLSPDKPRANIK